MSNYFHRFATLLCFGAFGWVISIFCYWGEVSFFFGFVYGLILVLVLLAFYLLLIIAELISNRVITLFNGPSECIGTVTTSHSYHKKGYLDIDIGTNYSSATYHPSSYDSWMSKTNIYKVGYAKYRSFETAGIFNSKKTFEEIYIRDGLLSRLGLTLWGLSPIWRSLVIFIPFLVNYIGCEHFHIMKPAEIDSIQSIICIMHIGIFVSSLFLKASSDDDQVKDDDRGHRPLHMQILGVFSDFAIIKLIQNIIVKHNLEKTIIHTSNYAYFFSNDFSINSTLFQFNVPYFFKDLVVVSLIEFAVYSIVMGTRVLIERFGKK